MRKRISFFSIRHTDIEILEKWIHKPHVRKWFHNPELWINTMREQLSEDALIHYNIIFIDNEPIGFAQWYDCFYLKEDYILIKAANSTYSIDYFFKDMHLSTYYGKEIIRELKDIILKIYPSSKIIVHPEVGNYVSQRLLLSKGYSFDKHTKDFDSKLFK